MDALLLTWINKDLANPIFDAFFPVWTDIQKQPIFFLVLMAFIAYFIYRKSWRTLKIMALAALGTFLADKLNHFVIKSLYVRPRPSDVILRIPSQRSHSFPSSHAVDAFFLAVFLGLFFPKQAKYFIPLAILTCFSRVYVGVHYPTDVLAGATLGLILAVSLYGLLRLPKLKVLTATLFLFFVFPALAVGDPTKGKPFFPWLWNEQLRPTLSKSVDKTGLTIAATGTAAAIAVHPFDKKVHYHVEDHHILFGKYEAKQLGKLGNGVFGVSIAIGQLVFDQENGLRHSRALLFTTLSHMSIAAMVRRHRPDNNEDHLPFPSAFPSGHASSAFATAGSLAYAYGAKAAIPAYLYATSIAISRLSADRHWASDIVAGAFLGTFWARASYAADDKDPESALIVPSPIFDGMMLTAVKSF